MQKRVVSAIVGVSMMMAGGASAVPLLAQSAPPLEGLTLKAKVICDEYGHCHRPPLRRPAVRWVYGDGNFYGPYEGPGYYGNPRLRYRVLPYWWW